MTLVHYDKNTGIFTRTARTSRSVNIGDIAGYVDSTTGYVRINICNRRYQAHRLAWVWVYGNNPENDIDHINSIRSDNRIANLREATRSENLCGKDKQSNNTSGFKGVSFIKNTKRYGARIKDGKKYLTLGSFVTPEEASEAYKKYAKILHGEFYKES